MPRNGCIEERKMQTLLKVLTGIFFALLFCAVLSLGGCLDSQPEPVIPQNIPTCHLCEFRSPAWLTPPVKSPIETEGFGTHEFDTTASLCTTPISKVKNPQEHILPEKSKDEMPSTAFVSSNHLKCRNPEKRPKQAWLPNDDHHSQNGITLVIRSIR